MDLPIKVAKNHIGTNLANGEVIENGNEIDHPGDLLCFKCKQIAIKDSDLSDAFGSMGSMTKDVIAKMTVNSKSLFYNMKHKRRGIALIFNHEHFQLHDLKSRSGTEADCSNLRQCLQNLGFEVHVYHDLPFNELYSHVNNVALADHSDCDCFLMAVLSHGESGIIYARDTPYKPEKLWTSFSADKCPSLAGKPKLFFLQACRGDQLDSGVILSSRTETDGYPSYSYRIPSQADFLIAYSTVPGYFSWRNTTRGSWFIQALCEELRVNGNKLDLLSLLTLVCQRVAIDYESNTPDNYSMHQRKQIPCITSMLTRYVIFSKKVFNSTTED